MFLRLVLIPVLGFCVLMTGCNSAPSGGGGSSTNTNSNDNNNANDSDYTPEGHDTILVILRNETDAVVETRFFSSSQPLANVPEDLYVEENLIEVGIGVAGTGMLIPLTQDRIEIECDENLFVGTDGGVFLDPDLGDPIGTGTQRWVQQGSIFDCGATLLFTYKVSEDDDDEFTVAFEQTAN